MIKKIRVEGEMVYFTVSRNGDFNFSLKIGGEEVYKSDFYCSVDNEYFISHPFISERECFLVVNKIQNIKLNFEVHHSTPWKTEKNRVGIYINEFFERMPEGDWACFTDGDVIHTSSWFGERIETVIRENLDFSMFSCLTNRTTPQCQIASESTWEENDISVHRNIGDLLWYKNKTSVEDVTFISPVSGYFFLVSKETWKKSGGFDETMMLGIEWDFCERVKNSGGKIGVMKGIYVYHWYRGGNRLDKAHLM
jgi:hypothetical protein